MKSNPTVSIIIPTWNTAAITLKCINTIEKYLPKNYFEIIVVDNASTDDTTKIFSKIKNIKYIRNSANFGFAKANNIGVKKAVGQYLFFLNSDMELVDSSLVKMVEYLKNNQNVGAIGPQFLDPSGEIQGSIMPPQTPVNAFKEYWLGIVGSYTKYYLNQTKSVYSISGGAILINRKIFDIIGGWDERYFFYGEDLELCRQIHHIGKNVIYYPSCKVIHYHGASGKNIIDPANQWRRQIPSSKIYHGLFEHYCIFTITWSRQKLSKIYSLFTK